MIHEPFQMDTIPDCCAKLVADWEKRVGEFLPESNPKRECAWTGERLFLGYCWSDRSERLIADIRFQVFPEEHQVFLGSIEIHLDFRERGLASSLLQQLEATLCEQGGEWKIRLFAQKEVASFWEKRGYDFEHDVRYLSKTISGST